jgi:carbon monoxide dehydrogenase subunit G
MDLRGDYHLAAEPASAWPMLVDPEVLRSVLPGCSEFREVAPEQYRVTLTVNLVAFQATVGGDVTITDRAPPDSYRVRVYGSGSAGSLEVGGVLRLAPDGSGSRLAYDLRIETTGALALMGSQVLEPAAKLIMGQFLSAMDGAIRGRLQAASRTT